MFPSSYYFLLEINFHYTHPRKSHSNHVAVVANGYHDILQTVAIDDKHMLVLLEYTVEIVLNNIAY